MKMIEEMKDFRAEDLDLTQSGQWPVLVKMIFWAFLFAVILAAGWWFVKESRPVANRSGQGSHVKNSV